MSLILPANDVIILLLHFRAQSYKKVQIKTNVFFFFAIVFIIYEVICESFYLGWLIISEIYLNLHKISRLCEK